MRRLASFGLVLVLLVPAGVGAQDTAPEEPRNEAVYQGLWCLYLTARPYLNDFPADVACEYERRPMTKAEAGAYYQKLAQDSNYVLHQWGCAERKAKGGLSWKQDRRWAERTRRVDKQWDRKARAVIWPNSVSKKIAKMRDLAAAHDYAQKRAYNHKDYAESYFSGDWGRYQKAGGKYSPVAQQVRTILGIPDVPDPGNDCKAVKRYERAQKKAESVVFTSPFQHADLIRVAKLLAGIGVVESQPGADGEPSLFLTDLGLDVARSMPPVDPAATPQEVVASLFSLATSSPEPSPSPQMVELVVPEPDASPAS